MLYSSRQKTAFDPTELAIFDGLFAAVADE
jgi:hypothetical protein